MSQTQVLRDRIEQLHSQITTDSQIIDYHSPLTDRRSGEAQAYIQALQYLQIDMPIEHLIADLQRNFWDFSGIDHPGYKGLNDGYYKILKEIKKITGKPQELQLV